MKKIPLTLLVFLSLSLTWPAPGNAGLFGKLVRETGEAASHAGKTIGKTLPSVEDGLSLARKLPHAAGAAKLVLLPGENNTWRLITSEGEVIPLASADELSGTLQSLKRPSPKPLAGTPAPAADAQSLHQYVAVRETDFFRLRDQTGSLPDTVDLQLVRANGRTYPLKPIRWHRDVRLSVDIGDGILLNPTSSEALDANIKFLNRGVNKANLKIARFDSTAAKTSGPASALGDPIAVLDPERLDSGLSKFKNRTLLVGGEISTDPLTALPRLAVKDNGIVKQIDLKAFEQAAERRRVNLIVVDAKAPAQPGTSWFSKTALEKRFDTARHSVTQADLLRALSPKGGETVINAGEAGDTRVVMTTYTLPASRTGATGASSPVSGYTATGWLLEAGLRATVHGVHVNGENPDYTDEVNSRWLPWIENATLIGLCVFIVIFAFISGKTWKWWSVLWRFAGRRTVGTETFSPPVRGVQIFLFLPFSLIMFLPAIAWFAVADYVHFFTWPVRALFGRKG